MPQDNPSKRIYPPPPPAQQLPQGYTDDTGQPVYNHASTYHNADPNYVEFSDPIQRLFYAILGAIPKPQEAASGLAKFATTSPKQLETQALQAAGRAASKPGMQQHPAMVTSEGFANTLLQFLGIPSESMAQRAGTGDISGAVGEGYGTYLAGKGLGKIGKKAAPFVDEGIQDVKATFELNKYIKQQQKKWENPIDKVMQEKISEQDNFNKWLKSSDLQWDKPADWYVPSLDGEWHTFLRNKYNQYLEDVKTGNQYDIGTLKKYYEPYQKQPEDYSDEYGVPLKFQENNGWWNDPKLAQEFLDSGGDKGVLHYLKTGKYEVPFKGGLYTGHRPQLHYGEEMGKQPIKEGYPNPEDYDSLKEFAQKRLYGHILNSLWEGYNERAINRLKNTDPEFEKLSEGIAEWKGSPKHLQDLTGDILFGKGNKVQNVYGYEAARSLADAYRTSPEVDYTLYRGIMVSQYGDPTPYLQLKPGDKLPFFRLHGYTQREKVADNFAGWSKGQYFSDQEYYSIKFVVEGTKKAINITYLNGFESEAEHLMNGEYLVKQVVTNGKKIKIIMQQERPLYAGQEESQAKPVGPGRAK